MLRGSEFSHSCSRDGIILGSADELAGVHAGPVSADFQFRCAFSGKTGREANLLDIELSYQGLYDAIQKGQGLSGTIEFFPEEGKYHLTGTGNATFA